MMQSSRGMPSNPGPPRRPRAPLPTLTEADFHAQGERQTLPPPVPIGELVEQMMGDIDGEGPPLRSPGSAADTQVTFEEVAYEADVLDEIGDAYLADLGSRAHIPFTLLRGDEALRMPLDHWAGFVLSLVDGHATVDEIIDASSMPEIEALRLLCDLREQGLIGLRPR